MIGILTALGVITFILEAYTWKEFIDEKKDQKKDATRICESTKEDQRAGSINKHQHGSEINQDGSGEDSSEEQHQQHQRSPQ